MISSLALKTLSSNEYKDLVVEFLSFLEGIKVNGIYIDSEGLPTIGIGWNLAIESNTNIVDFVTSSHGLGISRPISSAEGEAWDKMIADIGDAVRAGFAKDTGTVNSPSSPQEVTLQSNLDGIVTTYLRAYGGKSDTYSASFAFSSDGSGTSEENQEVHAVAFFKEQGSSYDDVLKTRLVEKGVMLSTQTLDDVLPYSWERLALWSLVYNSPALIGDGLATALKMGDENEARVAAWFEIRYRSNKKDDDARLGGIAKRRYAEAALFGLYKNPAAPTPQEAQVIIAFLEARNASGQSNLQYMMGYEQENAKGEARKLWQYAAEYDGAEAISFNFSDIVGADWNSRFLNQLTWHTLFKPIASQLFEHYKESGSAIDGSSFYFDGQVILGLTDKGILAPVSGLDIPGLGKNDLLIGIDGRDQKVDGKDGNDVLIGADSKDTLLGGDGNDVLYGKSGDDSLQGGPGDDTLIGGVGNDTYIFQSGDGVDTIKDTDRKGTVVIGGHVISDAFHFDGDLDNTYRTRTGETLIYYAATTTLVINQKDDGGTIIVESFDKDANTLGIHLNATPIYGYNGSDLQALFYKGLKYAVDALFGVPDAYADANQNGGNGLIAYVHYDAQSNQLVANGVATVADLEAFINSDDGVSTSTGYLNLNWDFGSISVGNENIYVGYSGDDNWVAGDGNDILIGGDGDDYFAGDTGNSAAVGGNDLIYAGDGDDTVIGAGGDDVIFGGYGNDTVEGGIGNDLISGDAGNDTLYGDRGADAYDVSFDYDDVIEGGEGNDTLVGMYGSDRLFGGAGNDRLWGDSAEVVNPIQAYEDDYLDGGDGDDTLNGQGGADTLLGGAGADTLYGDATDTPIEYQGNDYLNGGIGNDLLVGGGGSDQLYGGDGDDQLHGDGNDVAAIGQGDDILDGGAGNDSLLGYGGNDTLIGGDGNDTLRGDDGNDVLIGGAGLDMFDGGAGDDTYYLNLGDGTLVNGVAETIRDSGGRSRIIFGPGITAEDIEVTYGSGVSLTDVILKYSDTDYVIIENGLGTRLVDRRGWGFADDPDFALTPTTPQDIEGFEENDFLVGGFSDDTLKGGEGNDTLYGDTGNDTLRGEAGDDLLFGEDGNDVLSGGTGNDILDGGGGNDTYQFARGDGQDVIDSRDTTLEKMDVLDFDSDINPNDIKIGRTQNDLILKIDGTADRITVRDYFITDGNGANAVEQIRFTNGTTWNSTFIRTALLQGTAAAQTLIGYESADVINGLGGNDSIYGHGGNDQIDGGAGNDFLQGDAGSDTYFFGVGSGQDVINNNDADAASLDCILLGADIDPSSLIVTAVSGANGSLDLRLSINGNSNDVLTVRGYLDDEGQMIDEIRFANGTVWNGEAIEARLFPATENNDVITGSNSKNRLYGYGGNDTLYGRGGNDILEGGTGHDYLYGENGNDTIWGGEGGDRLFGGAGNDVLDGGSGDNDYWDTLDGGAGDDTYLYGRNSGFDVIFSSDTTPGKQDVILMSADITPDDVNLRRTDSGLALTLKGGGPYDGRLEVYNYFIADAQSAWRVEQIRFADGTIWDVNAIKAKVLEGTNENQTLWGYESSETIDGGAGNDFISGYGGNDSLLGGAGADILHGDEGNDRLDGGADDDELFGGDGSDVLIGGSGDDYLEGGGGGDTYLFASGGGLDTILELDQDTGEDTIFFDTSIAVGDAHLSRNNNDLLISIGDGHDRISIVDYFSSGDAPTVEKFIFADGTIWTNSDIEGLIASPELIEGTNLGETLVGTQIDDSMFGYGGSDILWGNGGNDTLYGGDGVDSLFGGFGDDVLIGGSDGSDYYSDGGDYLSGGAGNDTLYGGYGDDTFDGGAGDDVLGSLGDGIVEYSDGADTYLYGRGSGNDTIQRVYSYEPNPEDNVDLIKLGNGIAVEDVTFDFDVDDEDNLRLTINDTGEYLIVEGYFQGSWMNDVIYRIHFEDGTLLSLDDMRVLLGARSVIEGYHDQDETLIGSNGSDDIYGFSGDDYLVGNAGDDALGGVWGEYGNDTLDGGEGNDLLTGGDGSDTYVFARGAGRDRIDNRNEDDQYSDVIELIDGLTPADISLRQVGNDLFILFNGMTDRIQVTNHFLVDPGNPFDFSIHEIRFSNGVIWDLSDIAAMAQLSDSSMNLMGSASKDTLVGGSDQDTLAALAGNDTLDGGLGDDLMIGGEGNDVYFVDSTGDQVVELSGQGVDTVRSSVSFTLGENIENLELMAWDNYDDFDDTVHLDATGNALNNIIRGNFTNNLLDGGAGADTLIGGFGNDTYVIDNAFDVVVERFAQGTDTVISRIESYTLGTYVENLRLEGAGALIGIGNDEINEIYGGTADNTLYGGGGNDTLDGGFGADTMIGGSGFDRYIVDNVNDVIIEEDDGESDIVFALVSYSLADNLGTLILAEGSGAIDGTGNNQNNAFNGNNSDNNISGLGGDDYINGLDGDDVLDGGAGNDALWGDEGNDTYRFSDNFGSDVIYNGDSSTSVDDIVFDSSIDKANITLLNSGYDLFVNYGTNSILVSGYFFEDGVTANSVYAIDHIRFADGTSWDRDDIALILSGGTPNEAPIAAPDSATIQEDTAIVIAVSTLLANDSDVDNDMLSVASVSNAQHGTVTFDANTGEITFTPDADFYGAASFDYTVGDGVKTSTATVAINVGSVNDAPNVVADSAITEENEPLTIDASTLLANDSDIESDRLSIVEVSNAQHGLVTLNAETGNIVFVPDEGFSGTASFNYSVSDGASSSTSTVTVTVNPKPGGQTLTGTTGSDILMGGANDDRLDGGAGADTLIGGAGNDQYFVDDEGDVVLESNNAGVDTVNSSIDYTLGENLENLTLEGNAIGGTGNVLDNIIIGNDEGNTIDGGTGADTLAGGLGDDLYFVDNSMDVVAEFENEGYEDIVISTVDYTLPENVEYLLLQGNARIGVGNAGDNSLQGNEFNNTLYGGDGNDGLIGGGGTDTLLGGMGNDIYLIDDSTDVLIEYSGEGYDTVAALVDYTLGDNMEELYLLNEGFGITGIGNALDNVIQGNDNNNTLFGGQGTDTLFGDRGNDVLSGDAGADWLSGGLGNDTYLFQAGWGQDTVNEFDPNSNADTVLFDSGMSYDQLWFRHVGDDLEVSLIGTQDTITIEDWYLDADCHIDRFQSGDGKVLLDSQVDSLVNAMASMTPPASGQTTLPQSYQDQLGAVLAANWQ